MTEKIQAHCPECDGKRACDVHGETKTEWSLDNRAEGWSVYGGAKHSLLQCRGCDTVFYQKSSWNSEDIDEYRDHTGAVVGEQNFTKETYPRPNAKIQPEWLVALHKIDEKLENILSQMYLAHAAGLNILSAIGLRTALDRATEVLGIDPAISFDEKLDALKVGGWIGDTEREVLGVVTDAGNGAAHRGFSPDENEVRHLMTALELFLQRAFIVGRKPLDLKASIPPKPKRRKA